jgi:hypothetical protein
VAIGLALVAAHELKGVGAPLPSGPSATGDLIGTVTPATVTASCVVFEVIGPILAKVALSRAGEIPPEDE